MSGLNLLPVKSGIYQTRIEVREKVDAVKKGKLKGKKLKRMEVTIILRNLSNLITLSD